MGSSEVAQYVIARIVRIAQIIGPDDVTFRPRIEELLYLYKSTKGVNNES